MNSLYVTFSNVVAFDHNEQWRPLSTNILSVTFQVLWPLTKMLMFNNYKIKNAKSGPSYYWIIIIIINFC